MHLSFTVGIFSQYVPNLSGFPLYNIFVLLVQSFFGGDAETFDIAATHKSICSKLDFLPSSIPAGLYTEQSQSKKKKKINQEVIFSCKLQGTIYNYKNVW